MKDTLRCIRCDSEKVLRITGSSLNMHQKIPLKVSGFKNAVLDRYICAHCGYTEEYVQLTDSFRKWAEKWLKKNKEDTQEFV